MKTTAIICEYNPFHKGHLSQINLKKNNGNNVVCIMSGGFVQRGQPAIFDKYARAKSAITAGADLVLELPYPYSCSAAEFFCMGGVSIANSLKIIDELCFGSECGDIEFLKKTSERLSSDDFREKLKLARADKANKEKPFASLREEVYMQFYGEELPVKPNDILGLEYITALNKLKSEIVPFTYKREKGYSATRSRELITQDNSFETIPQCAYDVFSNADRYSMQNSEKAILAFYRSADPKELEKYEGMTNGIARKLIKCANESTSLDELLEKMAAKTYTNAKIRRCIINGILNVTPAMVKAPPAFTQVLGANAKGRELIRKIQKSSDLPILTKPVHYKRLDGKAKEQAEFNAKADSLLTLMCDSPKSADYFIKQTPFIEK